MPSARSLGVLIATTAAVTALGCGAAGSRRTTGPTADTLPTVHRATVVQLRLELPFIGLSSAPTVSFATTDPVPAVKGAVSPAGATVYMLGPDGTRTALNPRRDGSFTVRTKLRPGSNTFRFTAAKRSRSTRFSPDLRRRPASPARGSTASS